MFIRRYWWLLVIALTAFVVGRNIHNDIPVDALYPKYKLPASKVKLLLGMPVHFTDEGNMMDTCPLVLIHGTSASLHTWQGWVDQLGNSHRIIRMDIPAFGLTGPRPDGDYSLHAYSDFIDSLLQFLKVNQCAIAGNSLGGAIALTYTCEHPDRVKQLILVDAGGYPFQPKQIPIGFALARMPLVKSIMQHLTPYSAVKKSVEQVYGNPSKVTAEKVQLYFDLLLRAGNRKALVERLNAMRNEGDTACFAQIQAPTLIIWGENDCLIPPENAARFHRDIRNSQVVIFPGLGHIPMEEDPQTYLVAKTFLKW